MQERILITLTPQFRAALDEAASVVGLSRSEFIERMLSRRADVREAAERVGVRVPAERTPGGRPRKERR